MVKTLLQKTLYIYEEDDAAWRALPNKTQWAHNALAGITVTGAPSYKVRKGQEGVLIEPLQVNPKSHHYMEAPAKPHKMFPRNKKKL